MRNELTLDAILRYEFRLQGPEERGSGCGHWLCPGRSPDRVCHAACAQLPRYSRPRPLLAPHQLFVLRCTDPVFFFFFQFWGGGSSTLVDGCACACTCAYTRARMYRAVHGTGSSAWRWGEGMWAVTARGAFRFLSLSVRGAGVVADARVNALMRDT